MTKGFCRTCKSAAIVKRVGKFAREEKKFQMTDEELDYNTMWFCPKKQGEVCEKYEEEATREDGRRRYPCGICLGDWLLTGEVPP